MAIDIPPKNTKRLAITYRMIANLFCNLLLRFLVAMSAISNDIKRYCNSDWQRPLALDRDV
jgi:hypothetical protein